MDTEYFERLRGIIKDYNERIAAFYEEAEAYKESHTDAEYIVWCAANVPPRVAKGSDIMLLDYYDRNKEFENDEFVVDRDMGAQGVPRLIAAMRKAGMKSFVYAVTDKNCFDRLDDICFEDCRLDKPVQVRQRRHGRVMETTGIRIKL